MPQAAFLALDWGTTNLRAWVVDADGGSGPVTELPLGVSRLARGEAQARFHDTIRPALHAEGLPTLIAGMAGANIGWMEVPYVDCPADAIALAGGLKAVEGEDPPVRIVPGLRGRRLDGAPDVMRGEETQLFGWLAQDESRRRGERVICHPGTHAKWCLVRDGRIERFVTAMTGELFAVLSQHSVLRSDDDGDAFDDQAFNRGLEAAGDGAALAARLFTARSQVVGGGDLKRADVRAYLSGLLIGAEVASTPALLDAALDQPVALIGDGRLCTQYRRALERRGLAAEVYDGEDAVVSGLKTLFWESRP